MLVRCLYASRPSASCDGRALDRILEQARKNNPALGLTGLLCVSNNLFVQVLEGGRDEVCEIYNAIARDGRHQQVRLLIYEEISERRFGNWTMGQINIDRLKSHSAPEIFPQGRVRSLRLLRSGDLVAAG